MFSSATQSPPRGPSPPRHNFVSAMTFEGFKLPIQNGRRRPFCQTFCFKKLRIDLKWPEMRSKVICGHPKWPTTVRNAIQSDFWKSKMATGGHFF